MQVDYALLKQRLDSTIRELRGGHKTADRARKVELRHIANFESEVSNSEFAFRVDAAKDAGGTGAYARPMDYVLGGLLSCQHMWCLRWAALKGKTFNELNIEAVGRFTWRGEYLEEVDAGLIAVDVSYRIQASDLGQADLVDLADTVAKRCPVFATLRRAVPLNEEILLNGSVESRRVWKPGANSAERLPN
jgi:uncharacterized OsmC-like protein